MASEHPPVSGFPQALRQTFRLGRQRIEPLIPQRELERLKLAADGYMQREKEWISQNTSFVETPSVLDELVSLSLMYILSQRTIHPDADAIGEIERKRAQYSEDISRAYPLEPKILDEQSMIIAQNLIDVFSANEPGVSVQVFFEKIVAPYRPLLVLTGESQITDADQSRAIDRLGIEKSA